MGPETSRTIGEYLRGFRGEKLRRLRLIRRTIKAAAPGAVETISYRIPTFKLGGKNLVHFAGFTQHIGFFPTGSGVAAFKKALGGYQTSKGTIQFQDDEPVPVGLIRKIVKFRVRQAGGPSAKR